MIMRGALMLLIGMLAAGNARAFERPYNLEWWLDPATSVRVESDSSWKINVGGGGVFAPDYLGSDDYEVLPLPLIDIEWRGLFFASTARGAGVHLFRRRNIRAGARVTLDPGRDNDTNDRIETLDDVDAAPEYGLFGEAYFRRWRLRADIRKAFSGHEGWVLSVGAALGRRVADIASLFFRARARGASEDYMSNYFGVPRASATRNLSQFNADAGPLSADIGAAFVWRLRRSGYVALDIAGGALFGDASDSPVTANEAYGTVSAVVGYRF